mgnify:CR=1 FL=1
MSIAEYKKKNSQTKIIELEFFKVKIRKLKMKDYVNIQGVASLFSLEENSTEATEQSFSPETFKAIKNFVCSCVVSDPASGAAAIVDKSESQCKEHEISFDETLTDADPLAIFNAIQEFTSEGVASDDLATFQEESGPASNNNDNGKGVPQVSP